MDSENKYIEVIYNKQDKPFTEYPDKLARYLSNRFKLEKDGKFLDLGCGRGDFLKGFIQCGLNGHGVDQSDKAKDICHDASIKQADLAKESIPFANDFFDCIFSKSVLEHFYYPENLIKEIHRILKPGGLVITMVPDWEVVYKMFYDDYTHRKPFTKTSLANIFTINGFTNVECEKFRQLPFLWQYPWCWPITSLIALICPDSLKKSSKLIRFSKEVMLLATAIKPITTQE
nr:class I SAM-dependent methyltransferase [uncultured Desulfobacter sp.]